MGSEYLLPFIGHFEKTNEPFVIIINPPNVTMMNFSDITDVTISVSLINNGIHFIDKKYLPNIDWNSLKNKPFYDHSKKFEIPI
jgi:hypothetical protein